MIGLCLMPTELQYSRACMFTFAKQEAVAVLVSSQTLWLQTMWVGMGSITVAASLMWRRAQGEDLRFKKAITRLTLVQTELADVGPKQEDVLRLQVS